MKIKESIPRKIFNVFNILFMLFLGVIMFYPIWHVVCASFSNNNSLIAHQGVLLLPIDFNVGTYEKVFSNPMILKGYINTLIIVVSGVAINMVLTSIAAYCLSLKEVYWSTLIMKLFTFTMYFSGGLIPTYLLVTRTLGLGDTFWAIILPMAISTYNLIIMRTSFAAVPDSLIESAKLDGATHIQIMTKIVLPLSKAVLAVIALYYTVSHWNSWFPASIYLDTRTKYPLQLVLREILIENDTASMMDGAPGADQYSIGETIKYAIIVVATVPILLVYPFLQRYFTKGVMIGAIKG